MDKSILRKSTILRVNVCEHRMVSQEAVREPQLFKLKSGDILLTYHVQADTHFAERKGLRSSDGGKTWQTEPGRAHREQAIGEGAQGIVLAFDIYTFERKPGEYAGSYFKSEDGGTTFTGPHESLLFINSVVSEEFPTPDQFPSKDHPMRHFYQPLPEYYEPIVEKSSRRKGPVFWRYLVESDGRWLATMYGKFHGDSVYRTILVSSGDDGKTWAFMTTIAYFRCGVPGEGFDEPVLSKVADGSLLCIMRRGGGLPLAQCRSTDGGQTWSSHELLAAHGVDPDLFLMSNGILACTFGRPGMHVMFSLDGCGYSWGYRTEIGTWRSSSYMGITEIEKGKLLLVYDKVKSDVENAGRQTENCYVGATTITIEELK